MVADGPDAEVPPLTAGVRVLEVPRGGAAAARNAGIAATTAPWVCFLDDDDLWHPDRLAVTGAFLTDHPEAAAVTSTSWRFSSHPADGIDLVADDLAGCLEAAARTPPSTDMSYLDVTGRSYELLLERNRGNISGATVRRDVLEKAGCFPAGVTCAEDWMMFVNVARYTEWWFLDARLSFVRVHGGNNTTADPTNGLVTLRTLRAMWDDRARPVPAHRELSSYGADYRWTVQDAVWGSLRRRRPDLARECLREGFALLPRYRDRAYALVPPPVTWRIQRLAAPRATPRRDRPR